MPPLITAGRLLPYPASVAKARRLLDSRVQIREPPQGRANEEENGFSQTRQLFHFILYSLTVSICSGGVKWALTAAVSFTEWLCVLQHCGILLTSMIISWLAVLPKAQSFSGEQFFSLCWLISL